MYSNIQGGSVVGLTDEILATLNFHAPHRRVVQSFDAQMIPEKVFIRAPYRGNFDHLLKRKRGVWRGWMGPFSNKLLLLVQTI